MNVEILLSAIAPDKRGWVRDSNPHLSAYAKQTLPDYTLDELHHGGAAVTVGRDAEGRELRLIWLGDAPGLALDYAVLGSHRAPDRPA